MAETQNYQQNLPERPAVRLPLNSGQHILHLILTLLTFGLWGIVWFIRALQGNKVWADTQPGWQWGPWPYQGWQPPQPQYRPPYGGQQVMPGPPVTPRPRPQEPGPAKWHQ